MEYMIQLNEEAQIIHVSLTGKWNPTVDKAMALAVMSKVAETQVGQVLVDMRELQFQLPIINLFDRAKELREQRRQFKAVSVRVALVYRSTSKKTDDSLAFFENAAQNRGLPYRVFTDPQAALEWLKA